MLNYWLQVKTQADFLTLEMLVGDEIIMTKCFYYNFSNNIASCNRSLHDETEMEAFCDSLNNDKSCSFQFTLEPNEAIYYCNDTEIFTFKTCNNSLVTTVNTIMDENKRKQFTTELNKINRFIRCNLSSENE
jgi:hypothetical protein